MNPWRLPPAAVPEPGERGRDDATASAIRVLWSRLVREEQYAPVVVAETRQRLQQDDPILNLCELISAVCDLSEFTSQRRSGRGAAGLVGNQTAKYYPC